MSHFLTSVSSSLICLCCSYPLPTLHLAPLSLWEALLSHNYSWEHPAPVSCFENWLARGLYGWWRSFGGMHNRWYFSWLGAWGSFVVVFWGSMLCCESNLGLLPTKACPQPIELSPAPNGSILKEYYPTSVPPSPTLVHYVLCPVSGCFLYSHIPLWKMKWWGLGRWYKG